MNSFNWTGAAGEVRWSYQQAAVLTSWELIPRGAEWTVTAHIESSDVYRLAQQPLTFVVPRPQGAWCWPIRSLQILGETFTATLGPQEDSHVGFCRAEHSALAPQ